MDSKVREEILALLSVGKPVDAVVLTEKIKANKTSIYRQIDKLLSEGIVVSIEFGDGKKRYELASLGHHHHMVCDHCGKVEDLEIPEETLSHLSGVSNFKITRHNLEFFGLCNRCQLLI